ncbi:MAG: hypothetical protein ACXADA_17645 [Candidatus Hodarchaeales archaeon]|jgi:hypothetical protein
MMNEKEDNEGVTIALSPGEEVVAVLELEEKELPGIVLTTERLILATNLSDEVILSEDSGRADRFANRMVSGIQSRLHKGMALESIRDIRLEGRTLIVRAKLRRFLPTFPITSNIDDPSIDLEEIEAFLEEVRKQMAKLGQK